ncbi:MAG: hypothetical protein C4B59_10445 [Candidatus Methanogaster sp.]|uniref:Uncharacterized protein n=1 Tax=Candidatus Methanogaster sp. TaxID=3386292 RepID=A0AC61L1I5_9EURY|nr:MAG: hypothetical protein C4B59_10445 [ANME-2 cluster archaeon]
MMVSVMQKVLMGVIACVEYNIAELIVMTRYFPCSKHAIVLRTMIFGAGVLAGAGTVAGAMLGCG